MMLKNFFDYWQRMEMATQRVKKKKKVKPPKLFSKLYFNSLVDYGLKVRILVEYFNHIKNYVFNQN